MSGNKERPINSFEDWHKRADALEKRIEEYKKELAREKEWAQRQLKFYAKLYYFLQDENTRDTYVG